MIIRVDLGAIIRYWDKATTHKIHPHVALMLSGTFEAETGVKFFCQPLALQTDGGQNIGVWFDRLLTIRKDKGASKGPLFVGHKGRQISGAEMDLLFHALLVQVQRRFAKVLPESVDVKKEFSAYQSFCRELTLKAQNAGIPEEVIQANNRWRKRSRAKRLKPLMSITEHYSDARVGVPLLIRISILLPG